MAELEEISRICPPSNENLTILKSDKTYNIPVRNTHPPITLSHSFTNNIVWRERNLSNLISIPCSDNRDTYASTTQSITPLTTSKEFIPSLLLSNVMSLVPKIDEIRAFIINETIDFIFVTETWLKESIGDNQIQLPGYKVTRRDRSTGSHGGVCLYSRDTIIIKVLHQFDNTDLEVLWVHTRPRRLPRGVPCIVTGTVYHPPGANNNTMIEHLTNSLIEIEGQFPGCGIIIAGDFNKLNVKVLARQFKFKQLVHQPTRGNNILDLVLTNLHRYFDLMSIELRPPFGLSDHNSVSVKPILRKSRNHSCNFAYIRDTRPSRKQELGRYLRDIDWSIIQTTPSCEEKSNLFGSLINLGLDVIMPIKKVKLHHNDPPWITKKFKHLVKQRQKAFSRGDKISFNRYRNQINRERKSLRETFYSSKVKDLKESNPKAWWREVKRISGASAIKQSDLISQMQIESFDNLSPTEIANLINKSFLNAMSNYPPLEAESSQPNLCTTPFQVSSQSTYNKLRDLNSGKSPGPDSIPNWLYKEYAELLVEPITNILNSSYQEQKLPQNWKRANVTPVPKEKIVRDVNKHLRPISLTPIISKIAEDFVVENFVAPKILSIINPVQFGVIPGSSATLALIGMLHKWTEATDSTGAAVRVMLLDFRKAFDLIDHHLLVNKIRQLNMPLQMTNWVIDFLRNRLQRVKLAKNCFSNWEPVPAGVPQGTKLGPWLFILMLNDLLIPQFDNWIYVDDTTVSEVIQNNNPSLIQSAASKVQAWSNANKFHLNVEKCKELIFQFKRTKDTFPPINLESGQVELVNHAKILGLTISDDFRWNEHVKTIIKKANKRIYFIVQMKRANISIAAIVRFYCTCIRPVLEYSCEVFHHSLPQYLSDNIERFQKRVLSIILPGKSYPDRLELTNLTSLYDRRVNLSKKLFRNIVNNPEHKLFNLLPDFSITNYFLRKKRDFIIPRSKTNRFRQAFIPACVSDF